MQSGRDAKHYTYDSKEVMGSSKHKTSARERHSRNLHKTTCVYMNFQAQISSFELLTKEPQRG